MQVETFIVRQHPLLLYDISKIIGFLLCISLAYLYFGSRRRYFLSEMKAKIFCFLLCISLAYSYLCILILKFAIIYGGT